jgi:hypothetical protein
MSPKTTLHNFADVEPLEVREKVPVNANGRLVAWAGPSNREKNVVVSHRHRYKYDGGKQDYYRKHGSYGYDDTTLSVMEAMGAERIAVLEVDNSRIVEYQITQFRNSELASSGFDEGGENFCVPVEQALYTWNEENCTIIKDHD